MVQNPTGCLYIQPGELWKSCPGLITIQVLKIISSLLPLLFASLLFLAQPVAALEKRLAATAFTQTTCRTYITTKSTTATTSTTSLVLNLNPIVLYTKTPSTTVTPQATTSKIFLIAQTIGAFMLTLRNNYNSHIHGYYHRFCGDRYVQHHQYHHRINN
jgi:hypothetical protein